MLEVNGLPFTLDANNMIRANYQLNTKKYSGSIFCSELVAEAFQRAGIFSKSRLSSNYTPNDFSSLVPTKFLLSASLAPGFGCGKLNIRMKVETNALRGCFGREGEEPNPTTDSLALLVVNLNISCPQLFNDLASIKRGVMIVILTPTGI